MNSAVFLTKYIVSMNSVDNIKVCTKCGEDKPLEEYYVSKRDGIFSQCKTCVRLRTGETGRNRTPEQRRSYSLRARYGLTAKTYEELLKTQNGGCAICGTPPPAGKFLMVDHDHACCATHKKSCGNCIRGLLCFTCNVMIGNAGDDVVKLQNAITYLKR